MIHHLRIRWMFYHRVCKMSNKMGATEQEQIIVPEYLCSRPVFSGFRHTGFNYPFGIFKFFLALVVSYMYNSLIPWLYQLTFVTPCWWIIVHIPVFVGLSYCCFIIFTGFILDFRTVLRGYQRSYQKLYIEVEQTMQWSKEETKEQTTIYKRSHRKLKIEQHKSITIREKNQVLRKGNQVLLHMWHP